MRFHLLRFLPLTCAALFAAALFAWPAPALCAEGEGGATPEAAGEAPASNAHIALILPAKSRDFARAADALAAGFGAARERAGEATLPVQVYTIENESEQIRAAYGEALARGAVTVVAGLTRGGAQALAAADAIGVPTLALNQVERQQRPRGPLFSLNLSLEGEARQAVRLAEADSVRRVAVLAGPSPSARRSADAFVQEWTARGGELAGRWTLAPDAALLAALKDALQSRPFDAYFVAAEPALMRRARGFLPQGPAIYGTSQLNDGKSGVANAELADVRLLEMPWFAEPAHPAVAIYPRPKKPLAADLERLYALGIDAFRLATILTRTGGDFFTSLDGVTGRITLVDGYRFERELTAARFADGQVVPLAASP